MTHCYACAKPERNREHVPPRCLFPEAGDSVDGSDYRKNLITVPACVEHNLTKAGDDEYLLYVLSTSITSNAIALAQVRTKLMRAIARRPALTNSILEGSVDCRVFDSATGSIHEAAQVKLDGGRFQRSLELIARGLFYHYYGTRWDGALRVHADFIDFPDELNPTEIDEARFVVASNTEKLFAAEPRHGANQRVFWYQVHEPREALRCLMRLGFYDGSKAVAFFGEMTPRG